MFLSSLSAATLANAWKIPSLSNVSSASNAGNASSNDFLATSAFVFAFLLVYRSIE